MKYKFENGLTFIYKRRPGNLTSFCIGFNAGALVEDNNSLGLAHAVEHMIFKGTKTRNEFEINKLCDETFGFHNAMTNFPYAIYYGTTLSNDFEKGFDIYADILLNPTFPEDGFKEEMNIILEELKEWKDDIYQHCEDELLFNAFKERRIKNLIIGTEESVNSITLNNIKDFYNEFYAPKNCVITVVSSLSYEDILTVINKYFGSWEREFSFDNTADYEDNKVGEYTEVKSDIQGAKIQYCFPIHSLSTAEIKALNLFNLSFGEGTSSILYDEIRTKNGFAYEIFSSIKNENGIKLFNIVLGTSKENIDRAISLINSKIEEVKNNTGFFNADKISSLAKSFRLKRELRNERSIELTKMITTYEIMYGDYDLMKEELADLENITEEDILRVINKVLVDPSIQVIRP